MRGFLCGYLQNHYGVYGFVHSAKNNFPLSQRKGFDARPPLQLFGRNVYLIKTHAKELPAALDVETVAVIHVVRHPLDVLASGVNFFNLRGRSGIFFDRQCRSFDELVDSGLIEQQIDDFIAHRGFRPLLGHMGNWLEHTLYWSRPRGDYRHISVRYEDLRRDPHTHFAAVLHLLGHDFDPGKADRVNAKLLSEDDQSVDPAILWKRSSNYFDGHISADQVGRIQDAFGPGLERFGYEI